MPQLKSVTVQQLLKIEIKKNKEFFYSLMLVVSRICMMTMVILTKSMGISCCNLEKDSVLEQKGRLWPGLCFLHQNPKAVLQGTHTDPADMGSKALAPSHEVPLAKAFKGSRMKSHQEFRLENSRGRERMQSFAF